MGKIFSILLGLVLILFGYYIVMTTQVLEADLNLDDQPPVVEDEEITEFNATEYFSDSLFKRATELRDAIPVEGYEPEMLLDIFPNLSANDFQGVEAYGGQYLVEEGIVIFAESQGGVKTSADRSVSQIGMQTLLVNVLSRTGRIANSEASINELINFLSDTDPSSDPLIKLDNLESGDQIASPFVVTGEAPLNWFFEGDFPVRIFDFDREAVLFHYATIQVTSEDYSALIEEGDGSVLVPFKTTLEFVPPLSSQGFIVFYKDDPKGSAETESVEIPVFFE